MSLSADAPVSKLRPRCPRHYEPMTPVQLEEQTFACAEGNCTARFDQHAGYFTVENGKRTIPNDLTNALRPALVREHGYLCISEIDTAANTRTWRCMVNDCTNILIENLD
jgi:hypothetical protein